MSFRGLRNRFGWHGRHDDAGVALFTHLLVGYNVSYFVGEKLNHGLRRLAQARMQKNTYSMKRSNFRLYISRNLRIFDQYKHALV